MASRVFLLSVLLVVSVPASAAPKTCADFCMRFVECVKLADSSADPREVDASIPACIEQCKSGQLPQAGLDCLAEMKCWKGMAQNDLRNAMEACDPAKLGDRDNATAKEPEPGARAEGGAAGTTAESSRNRLVGRWNAVLWDDRNAPAAQSASSNTIEFRDDGTVVMVSGGQAQPGRYTWTLDTSHSPYWLDIVAQGSAGSRGDVLPGLLEWTGEDAAAFQLFRPSPQHPTHFQDGFTSRKQFLRRLSSAPAASAQPAGERVVYKVPPWDGGAEPFVLPDPDDAMSVAKPLDGDRSIVWHLSSGGERRIEYPNLEAGVTLHPTRFVRHALVVEAVPFWRMKGKEYTNVARFGFALPDRQIATMANVPFDVNTRIDRARIVPTVNGPTVTDRGFFATALYAFTRRDFDGEKAIVRVVTYQPPEQPTTLDAPAQGVDIGRVAYFDQAKGVFVMVDGEVWDAARGKSAGRIAGVDLLWWVESVGAFYTLDVKESPARPWGIVDATTGAIVGGGKHGGELILSRLEIDETWKARRVEVARAVVPIEGHFAPESAAAATQMAATEAERDYPSCPSLAFDISDPETHGSRWHVMPSSAGPVLFTGHFWITTQAGSLASVWLSLLVDPQRPSDPIPLYHSYSSVSGSPVMLATFPASPDGSVLGLRPVFARRDMWETVNYSARMNVGLTPFALERATGTIRPVPDLSWRKAPAAPKP